MSSNDSDPIDLPLDQYFETWLDLKGIDVVANAKIEQDPNKSSYTIYIDIPFCDDWLVDRIMRKISMEYVQIVDADKP